jgi:hypothetical protein
MDNPAGESSGEALRLDFDRRLLLQFRGSVAAASMTLAPPANSSTLKSPVIAHVAVRRDGCV